MGEMKERMLRGDLYLAAGDPDLEADAARCDELLAAFNATRASQGDERRRDVASRCRPGDRRSVRSTTPAASASGWRAAR